MRHRKACQSDDPLDGCATQVSHVLFIEIFNDQNRAYRPERCTTIVGIHPSTVAIVDAMGLHWSVAEYEDTFPYHSALRQLCAPHVYPYVHACVCNECVCRRDDLRAFLIDCRTMGLEVIPLVQTFGHMEVCTTYACMFTNIVCIETHEFRRVS